jgi:hypothetical protein
MTTSTSKLSFLLIISIFLLTSAAASFHGASGTDNPYETLEMPHYESHAEILTELVAPFLLIFFVFQIGLKQALKFALSAEDKWHEDRKAARKQRNKYATLIALAVTLMLIPTKLFQDINELIFVVFGSLTYILFLGAGLVVLYMAVKAVF